ncbi:MAG: ZmpA/ZmpB/ZmpC family metallo-endopeptidase-related protein [Planctomycetia bacterium]|nr:ZmpA/ZmpB/ZmpC family metallo-endopeptidase-related protein [Planctomycetia bacterium]
MQKKYNKTWSLRMEALECRQMLSVMGAGTDDTATDYAQEMVASYATGDDLDSATMSLMSLAAEEGETATFDKWDGSADTSWWDTKAEGQTKFTLTTAEQLAGLAQLVNNGIAFNYGNTTIDFHDYSITLATDIDLAGHEWTPIGELGDGKYGDGGSYVHSFRGTFNGDGHTIDNLTITDKFKNGSGLFGHIEDANIGNFKMTNVNITGERYVAAVAAKVIFDHSNDSSIHDVTVEGMNITGRWYTAGIVGYCDGDLDLTNCKVIGTENANTIEGVRYDADYDGVYEGTSSPDYNPWTEGNPGEHGGAHIGGIGAYLVNDITITGCTVKDVNITGAKRVGGISGSLNEYKNDNIFNHTNNQVINVNILAKGDHETENSEDENNTYYVGAMFGADGNAYDFSNTNNVFQNVTVSISDKDGSNVREIATSMVGNVSGVEDLNAPVAQIVDADGKYASFSSLDKAAVYYDALNGKAVTLLADLDLGDVTVADGVSINTGNYNLTATLVSETLVNITFNGVTYTTDKLVIVDNTVMIGTLETPSIVEKDGVYSIVDNNTNCTYVAKVGTSLSNMTEVAVNADKTIDLSAYAGKKVYVQVTASKDAYFDSETYRTTLTIAAEEVKELGTPTITVADTGLGTITLADAPANVVYVLKVGTSLSNMTEVTVTDNTADLSAYAGKKVYIQLSATAEGYADSETYRTTLTIAAKEEAPLDKPAATVDDGVITVTKVEGVTYEVKVGTSLSNMKAIEANNGSYDLKVDYAGKKVYVQIIATRTSDAASETTRMTITVPAAEVVPVTSLVKPVMTISTKALTIAGLAELVDADGKLEVKLGTSLSKMKTVEIEASIFKDCKNEDGTYDATKVYTAFVDAVSSTITVTGKRLYVKATAISGDVESDMYSGRLTF